LKTCAARKQSDSGTRASEETVEFRDKRELRGEFLNAFNCVNFNSISSTSGSSLNMGLVNGGFTDNSNSQDPGGRLVQIVLRLNF